MLAPVFLDCEEEFPVGRNGGLNHFASASDLRHGEVFEGRTRGAMEKRIHAVGRSADKNQNDNQGGSEAEFVLARDGGNGGRTRGMWSSRSGT